jgi:hypothetical protein
LPLFLFETDHLYSTGNSTNPNNTTHRFIHIKLE